MPRLRGALLYFCGVIAPAATLDFTFKGLAVEASLNGGPLTQIDLSVDLLADTGKMVNGGGWFGSDRYLNLKGFFSSKALGLSSVEAVTPLDVHIGGPAADPLFRDNTVLLVSGSVVNGMFNMKALGAWDRVSSIGPLLGPATAAGVLKVVLKNGDTLSITTFESAQPFGNASFQAHVMPEAGAAPVTGSLRRLGEKDLVLEGKGNTVLRFRLLAKTQFRDEQGSAIRDSLLHPGDQLSVSVSPDDPETAVGVVLVHRRDRP